MAWTTDDAANTAKTIFGPDGPWQAVMVARGKTSGGLPFWPSDDALKPFIPGNFTDSQYTIRSAPQPQLIRQRLGAR